MTDRRKSILALPLIALFLAAAIGWNPLSAAASNPGDLRLTKQRVLKHVVPSAKRYCRALTRAGVLECDRARVHELRIYRPTKALGWVGYEDHDAGRCLKERFWAYLDKDDGGKFVLRFQGTIMLPLAQCT